VDVHAEVEPVDNEAGSSAVSGRLVSVRSGWDPEGMTEVSGLSELLAMRIPRPLTVEDLFRLPDDGWRYELVDGSLIVSPPPVTNHQRTVVRLTAPVGALVPSDARRYDVVHEIGPGQSVTLTDPFPVTLTPEELLR
jgi:hypothetical protein